MLTTYYILAKGYAVQKIEDCFNPAEAKREFRHRFGLKKIPSGSIITSDPNNEMLRRAASQLDRRFLNNETR